MLPIVMGFMEAQYNSLEIHVSASFFIFAFAATFTLITLFISIRKPVKTAASVSPATALKYTEKKKDIRVHKNSQNLSVSLPFRQISQNKRRTAFIIISLTLCFILLNSIAIIAQSVDEENMLMKMINNDYILASENSFNSMHGYYTASDSLYTSSINELREAVMVENERILYKNTSDNSEIGFDCQLEMGEIVTKEHKGKTIRYRELLSTGTSPIINEHDRMICNTYGTSPGYLSSLEIVDGEKDPEKLQALLEQGDSIILGIEASQDGSLSQYRNILDVGQVITAYNGEKQLKEYTIVAKAAVRLWDIELPQITTGLNSTGGDGPLLYFSEQEFKSIYKEASILNYSFDAKEGNEDEVRAYVEAQRESGAFAYTSSDIYKKSAESMKEMIAVVGGIIGGIFGLAGIMNFVNVTAAGIITRRQEFATMQSVGMTKKQLNGLIRKESLLIVLLSGICGIALSVLFGISVMKIICDRMWYFSYKFTALPAIVLTISLLILAIIISAVFTKLLNKGSVVDKLRRE